MIYSSKDDRRYRFVFCGQDVWESLTPPQLADHKLQVCACLTHTQLIGEGI